MEDFITIEDFYSFIEKTSLNEDNIFDISRSIKELSNKVNNKNDKDKLLWENYFFDFYLDEGKVRPQYSQTTKDGIEIWGYPRFEDFSDSTYTYLQSRIEHVKSPYLKARYSHIMWGSPQKNQKYAKYAVDSYIKIIDTRNKRSKKYSWDILNTFRNAFKISLHIRYNYEKLIEKAKLLLFNDKLQDSFIKMKLIECLIEGKGMEKQFLEKLNELTISLYNDSIKDNDYSLSEKACEVGERLSSKLLISVTDWKKRKGDFYKSWAENRMNDDSRMIPLSMYHRALIAYKEGGCQKEVEEIGIKYINLKKELKLNNIRIPYSDKDHKLLEDILNEHVSTLLKLPPEKIFLFLATHPILFPTLSNLKKMNKSKDFDFMNFATQIRFDENKNISNSKSNSKDLKDENLLNDYRYYLNNYSLNFLSCLFTEGIKIQKINFKEIISYLYQNSWLGQIFTDFDAGGEVVEYSWLSLIAPSFNEFFFQSEAVLKSKDRFQNHILPIDSLTLKFEGALRDFAQKNGVNTITSKGEEMREKYLEDLLQDGKLIELFNENDVFLFQFIFTNKGLNLRNKIAHCFMKYSDYYLAYMYLLLVCFLRLGKYKLVEKVV